MTAVTVRIGFVGCGFIARYHALQLALCQVNAPCEVVACHDPGPGRAEAFVRELGDTLADLVPAGPPAVLDSVARVVESVDAVFVCTWTAAHREAVALAADAGRPVFCEKPLGVDLVDAGAVADELERCPVHAVGLVLRSSPAMLAFRELIDEPAAGRLMAVVFRDDQFLPVRGMYGSDWRADPARAGSGVLLEHSIHDADMLEWLAGPIESVAMQQGFFHDLAGIEDVVSAVGRYRSGATFTLSSVWHEIDARPSQRRVEAFCENRLVTLEGDVFGPVTMQSDDEFSTLDGDDLAAWLVARGIALVSAEQRFLEAVATWRAGGAAGRVRPDAADALQAHRLVEAMYASATADGASKAVLRG